MARNDDKKCDYEQTWSKRRYWNSVLGHGLFGHGLRIGRVLSTPKEPLQPKERVSDSHLEYPLDGLQMILEVMPTGQRRLVLLIGLEIEKRKNDSIDKS